MVRKIKWKLLQKTLFLSGFGSVAVEGTDLSDCLSGSDSTEFINKLVLSNGEMFADPGQKQQQRSPWPRLSPCWSIVLFICSTFSRCCVTF